MKLDLIENGPILVTKSNGTKLALCRCGKTQHSPYCDGRHLTARRGFVALVVEDELPRSDYRDWEYQNQLDEQEKTCSCNCGSCACDDGGCECHFDDE